MRLLILTQTVDSDDPVLGFFCAWLRLFSKEVDELHVVCLQKGRFDAPPNTHIYSLGKEHGKSRIRELVRLYAYMWKLRGRYDVVLVHMNPIYVVLLGVLWKIQGVPIGMWYTHKSVTVLLRIAEKLCDRIFTASQSSFRLKSAKVLVVGHGIDTDIFAPLAHRMPHDQCVILSVGRITRSKNQLLLMQALASIRSSLAGKRVKLIMIGAPATGDDVKYLGAVYAYIQEHNLSDSVEYAESKRHEELVEYYQNADIFVNLSTTGSLDKVVLEACATNLDVLTSNEAFRTMLPSTACVAHDLPAIAHALRDKITHPSPVYLRERIIAHHTLERLIKLLVNELGTYVRN